MKKLIFLCFVILVAGPAQAQFEHPFIGGWELQSITQPDGTVITPQDMGYTVQLDFQSDGSFIRYQDGAIVHQGQWMLSNIWVTYFGHTVCIDILQTTGGDDWHSPMGSLFSDLTLRTGNLETPTEENYIFIGITPVEQQTLDSVRAMYR